ncbi:MAG: biopolymer transporter ExbB [SAR86 cluster bacterium]|uniref:Biopolymer transporter ExbB n=1 Tax=SAR86 cluster bacterium TaxID=2030880 RepID=A0A2A5CAK3_9GAMM|nr:MAG: biopolymer transporter ExbB [SAR86 cluster bacterium]
MLPIILCSVLAIAIVIERFWTLKPSRIAPKNMLPDVWSKIKQNQLDASELRDLRNSSALGQILAAGLVNAKSGRTIMIESIEQAAGHVIHEMSRYLNLLGTISQITPLLGLLGTVLGMIRVFSEIMAQGTGNANVLAGGISEALITTAAGLTVAIPTLLFYRFFQRKIDTLVIELERESIKLVDALHSSRTVDYKDSNEKGNNEKDSNEEQPT